MTAFVRPRGGPVEDRPPVDDVPLRRQQGGRDRGDAAVRRWCGDRRYERDTADREAGHAEPATERAETTSGDPAEAETRQVPAAYPEQPTREPG